MRETDDFGPYTKMGSGASAQEYTVDIAQTNWAQCPDEIAIKVTQQFENSASDDLLSMEKIERAAEVTHYAFPRDGLTFALSAREAQRRWAVVRQRLAHSFLASECLFLTAVYDTLPHGTELCGTTNNLFDVIQPLLTDLTSLHTSRLPLPI